MLASRNLEELSLKASGLTIRYDIKANILPIDLFALDTHPSFCTMLPCRPDIIVIASGILGSDLENKNNMLQARKVIDTNTTGVVSIINRLIIKYQKQHNM